MDEEEGRGGEGRGGGVYVGLYVGGRGFERVGWEWIYCKRLITRG